MNTSAAQESQVKGTHLSHWAGAVLVCVMLLGFWQFSASLNQLGDMTFPKSWVDFREGRTTGTLEKQLDQKMPQRSNLIAGANSLRYLLLNGANDQVRIGKSDWLFLTEELQYDTLAESNMATRLELLGKTSRALQAKGVKLLIAVVPDKARIYEQYLPNGHYPQYNASRYQVALKGLRAQQVDAVDLLSPLLAVAKEQLVYYRSDTHWNQVGAQVAAQALSDHLRLRQIQLDETKFSLTQESLQIERAGDLIRLMGLENMPNWLRPLPDMELQQTITEVSKAELASLFGGSTVAVVLTGTSYSLRGNFHGHLQYALSCKVLNSAKDGGGFLQATGDYLKDDAFKTEPPQVIVWELPERFLTLPLTQEANWLKIHFPRDK